MIFQKHKYGRVNRNSLISQQIENVKPSQRGWKKIF